MSRTLRRGKPSRDRHHYQKLGVIWGPNEVMHAWWRTPSEAVPYWIDDADNPGTYSEYVTRNVREHHQDKRRCGTPRYVRHLDIRIQTREHRHAIHSGLRTGDFDITLTRLAKRNSWNYW
jgi:hypothetical protein